VREGEGRERSATADLSIYRLELQVHQGKGWDWDDVELPHGPSVPKGCHVGSPKHENAKAGEQSITKPLRGLMNEWVAI